MNESSSATLPARATDTLFHLFRLYSMPSWSHVAQNSRRMSSET
jgi:hypothetical protein